MSSDLTRPRIHFTPQSGWINDPLGLTYREGLYHLFFQFVPGQTEWGPHQSWGHATSPDGLHWTEGPVVLEPGDGDDGVWSGSIVRPPGEPAALFYTTVTMPDVQIGKARIARALDASWNAWSKGPVVVQLPEDIDAVAFRDPFVFHDGTTWRMLMGAGLTDGTATALTFASDDLQQWRYDGLLATRHQAETEPIWTGAVWECPQMFPLGDKWVLTISVWEPGVPYYEAYAIGTYGNGRFTAETWGRLSYGPAYYAGSAFKDRDDRPGLIYWLRAVDDPSGKWASAHSVPHVLRLDGDRVIAAPTENVVKARSGAPVRVRGDLVPVGPVLDIELRLDGPDARAALTIDGDLLQIATASGRVTVTTPGGEWAMPLGGADLRIIVDGPVVELFTTAGVLAAPIPVAGEVRALELQGGAVASVWGLR